MKRLLLILGFLLFYQPIFAQSEQQFYDRVERKLKKANYTWCSYTQAVKGLTEKGWRNAKEYYPNNYTAQERYAKKYEEKWWPLLNKKIGLTKQEGQVAHLRGIYFKCI